MSGRADGMFTALNVDILLPRMNSADMGPNFYKVIAYVANQLPANRKGEGAIQTAENKKSHSQNSANPPGADHKV